MKNCEYALCQILKLTRKFLFKLEDKVSQIPSSFSDLLNHCVNFSFTEMRFNCLLFIFDPTNAVKVRI